MYNVYPAIRLQNQQWCNSQKFKVM